MLHTLRFFGTVDGFSVVVIILALLVFIFEVVMLISAIQNKHITSNAKVLWIVGMLLIHPFVAIVYYITDYKKAA